MSFILTGNISRKIYQDYINKSSISVSASSVTLISSIQDSLNANQFKEAAKDLDQLFKNFLILIDKTTLEQTRSPERINRDQLRKLMLYVNELRHGKHEMVASEFKEYYEYLNDLKEFFVFIEQKQLSE